MSGTRYAELKSHFIAVSELSDDNRTMYLRRLGRSDAGMHRDLERLLAADSAEDGFFATADLPNGAGRHPEPAARPQRIASYRITDVLGAGGMGVVYRAEQENPRRAVALKVLRGDLLSRRSMRRFELEAQALARLQHPGIAHIYEAGRCGNGAGGQPFFAMELVDGVPLMAYAASGDLRVRERLRLFVKVCRAVEHAHQHGVIHRDLKPANILVTAAGEPKILDFGVARLADSRTRTTTLRTETGQIIGTVAYMSPEQIAGDADAIDGRSDVYALGVILYELLTGTLPLDPARQTIPEAFRMIREQDPVPLGSIDRHLRGDLDTIAAKALEKSTPRRYASAAALADDVERHLRHQPITARPPGVIDGLRKFARRHLAAAAGIAGAFTVVLATAIVFLSMYGATHAAVTQKRAALAAVQEANRRAASAARDLWVSTSADGPQTWPDSKADDAARAARASAARATEAYGAGRFGEAAGGFVEALSRWHQAELSRESSVDRILAAARSAIASGRVEPAEAALDRLRAMELDDAVIRPIAAEVNLLHLDMVAVPPGTFMMGGDRSPKEQPAHPVHIARGFRISATEITQGQFLAVMGHNPSIFADLLAHPVENVSWFDALEFCNDLSERMDLSPRYRLTDVVTAGDTIISAVVKHLDGTGFRLPTEAEWEYACRAGTQGIFVFGDSVASVDGHAWHRDNSDSSTHPVATKIPNRWGLYDMQGNVWEWCEDPWHESYQGEPADDGSDWQEGGDATQRVLRGSCWADEPQWCRAAYRHGRPPGSHLQYRGFRIAQDVR